MELAGAPGIEPGNAGIKIRCLTAWRRPKIPLFKDSLYSISSPQLSIKILKLASAELTKEVFAALGFIGQIRIVGHGCLHGIMREKPFA